MALKFIKNRYEPSITDAPKTEEANWLLSYADMVTNLLCFFMLFFNLSKFDPSVFMKIKDDIKSEFFSEKQKSDAQAGNAMLLLKNKQNEESYQKLIKVIEDEKGAGVNMKLEKNMSEMLITFPSERFFESGITTLVPRMKDIINKLAGIISKQRGSFEIVVEGHSDSSPLLGALRAKWTSNWELSAARAAVIVDIFLNYNIAKERLSAVGYADSRPFVLDRTVNGKLIPENMAKNRRIVIRLKEVK